MKKKAKKTVSIKKKKKVPAVPKGYHSLTPYLMVDNAAKAIEFYKKAFGAKVVMAMKKPDGKIGHAELVIGDSKLMIADKCPEMDESMSYMQHLYIKNVDGVMKKAIKHGAKVLRATEDMFYGDRSGAVRDPFGNYWNVSTHIENVTPKELKKRAGEMYKKKKS
jgi:PhnB protein